MKIAGAVFRDPAIAKINNRKPFSIFNHLIFLFWERSEREERDEAIFSATTNYS